MWAQTGIGWASGGPGVYLGWAAGRLGPGVGWAPGWVGPGGLRVGPGRPGGPHVCPGRAPGGPRDLGVGFGPIFLLPSAIEAMRF